MTIEELKTERQSAQDCAELLQNLLEEFKDAAEHESRSITENHKEKVIDKIEKEILHVRALEEFKENKIKDGLNEVEVDTKKLHSLDKELKEFNAKFHDNPTTSKMKERDKILKSIGLVTSRLMQNLGTDQLVKILHSEKLLQSE